MATAKKVVKKSVPARAPIKKIAAPKAKISSKKSAPVSAKAAPKTKTKAATTKKPVRKVAARAPKAGKFDGLKPIKTAVTDTMFRAKAAEKIDAAFPALAENRVNSKHIVAMLMDFQQRTLAGSLMKGAVGSFKIGALNVKSKFKPAVKVPAIKKGTMLANPFAGGEIQAHKGRPASVRPAKMVVKGLPMKALKDAIAP